MELSKEEIKVILGIARRHGCERDGDILKFVVKEDMDIAYVIDKPPLEIRTPNEVREEFGVEYFDCVIDRLLDTVGKAYAYPPKNKEEL